MSYNKKHIVFVGLYDDANLGDKIITRCTEWLFNEYGGLFNSKLLSLQPNITSSQPSLSYRLSRKLLRLIVGKLYPMLPTKVVSLLKNLEEYYYNELKGNDLVIFVGGGLIKYQYQFCCWGSVSSVIRAAYRLNIPIVINAVGVEGYDSRSANCLYLKKALHLPNVKSISIRDDIQTLKLRYFDGKINIPCKKVADPAVWASEVYGIARRDSDVIGIGVVWAEIFEPREYKVSAFVLVRFYIELIKALTLQGRKVEMFTNGDKKDNETAKKIKGILDKDGLFIQLRLPNSDVNLIEIISQYEGIVAPRMHSAIVAYSLNIPCIGMIWNEKVMFWGKNINREEWFLRDIDLNVDNVMHKLKKAIQIGYNQQQRDMFRRTIVNDIIQTIERENLK